MSKSFMVAIPARYGSTRFPGKPLAPIAGRPMILHTCDRAREAGAARVVVATDHQEIAGVCTDAGHEVIMTSADHQSGTDRLAEVVTTLALADDEIVINLQGDEPLMPPDFIRRLHARLSEASEARMATLVTPLATAGELHDPNVVKVVINRLGEALYFSRAPIPWDRQNAGRPASVQGWYRHLGIYAYRVAFLRDYPTMQAPELERIESLEQLRALWHGETIVTARVEGDTGPGIDTPEQLHLAEAALTRLR
jgi:3-deoxy-manno-octulosonate cytidylyltransferase (CMP-KDO synthetase)